MTDALEELFAALKTACQEKKRETVVLVSGWPGFDRDLFYYIPKVGQIQHIDSNNRSHGPVDPRLIALGFGRDNLAEEMSRAIERVKRVEIDYVSHYDDA